MLFCWPIVLVLSAVRGILMIYQLNRRGDYIQVLPSLQLALVCEKRKGR
jgi:hypothetical protein